MTRILLTIIALLLLAVLPACWFYSQPVESRPWLEVDAAGPTACYQGPPLEVVVQCRLWPGGPSVQLIRERRIHLAGLHGD